MIRGLNMEEVKRRRAAYGPNTFWSKSRKGWWSKARSILEQPMFLLLLLAALIYLAFGDLEDGLALFVVVLVVIVLTFIQERNSQKALDALRDMAQPYATVLRDGALHRVAVKDIVLGDVLCLSEGQQVGADARLVEADYMEIDESLMTGESAAVIKAVGEQVLAGTCVIHGEGLARVTGIGRDSAMGKMDEALQHIRQTMSPVQQQTTRLIQALARVVLIVCTLMWFVQGWLYGNWLGGFLAAVVLAMSLLPEEYAVVLSIFPALGAKRLAAQGVLTTHLQAIETLGACTVICTDKTGTLTQNHMTPEVIVVETSAGIQSLNVQVGVTEQDSPFGGVLRAAALASSEKSLDAMDVSLRQMMLKNVAADGQLLQSFPLHHNFRVIAQTWRWETASDANIICIAAKGAPEDVMKLCQMSTQEAASWATQVDDMAHRGLRVIAVAKCDNIETPIVENLTDYEFQWLGLIGFRDPLRTQIPDAFRACEQAGIRVVMITGDHPNTALAIARKAGLVEKSCVLGDSLQDMTPQATVECVRTCSVFARVSPLMKVKIVQALQADQQIVAMIGDGVNDVVALRAANVSVAMGMRGTDVARRTADLILLNDSFASLISGIRLGRSIFMNMQKSMSYLLAVHMPIAALAMLPMIFNSPSLLLPLHMACLELVIDPACSVVFENEPPGATVMTTPPRNIKGHVLGRLQIQIALGRGLFALLMVAISYVYAISQTDETTVHRTIVFVTLLIGNVMLMISYRQHEAISESSWISNLRMWILIVAAIVIMLCAVYWPMFADAFKFVPLGFTDFLLASCFGVLTGAVRFFVKP